MQNAFCNIFNLIKLQFVIKIIAFSIFEWPFYTGFTVLAYNKFCDLQYTDSVSSTKYGPAYEILVLTPDRRQSKTLLTIDERGSNISRKSVIDCHLSPDRREMAIKNSVSNYFLSTFDDSINVSISAYPVWYLSHMHEILVLTPMLTYPAWLEVYILVKICIFRADDCFLHTRYGYLRFCPGIENLFSHTNAYEIK